MSKRKPAKGAKQARSKVAAKAQRARQAVVRSPKPSQVHLIAAGPNKSLRKIQKDIRRDAPVLEKPMAALPVVESPAIASQDESQRTMRENNATKAFDTFSAPENVRAHQTEPPEIAQAMQLAFEFATRLAQIKSPFEFSSVLSELTIKQFAVFQNFVFLSRSPREV